MEKTNPGTWNEPFYVEFRTPVGIKNPWEVKLKFDISGNIIAIDGDPIIIPTKTTPGGVVLSPSCAPGTCPRMIAGIIFCKASYCL